MCQNVFVVISPHFSLCLLLPPPSLARGMAGEAAERDGGLFRRADALRVARVMPPEVVRGQVGGGVEFDWGVVRRLGIACTNAVSECTDVG